MELFAIPLLLAAAIGLLFMDGGDPAPAEENSPEPTPEPLPPAPLQMQVFGAGSDTITGTDGRDQIELGDGDDVADGGAADDRLFGQDGNDQVWGGAGDDRIFLGDGTDSNFDQNNLTPDQVAGDDFIRGGDGEDLLVDFLGHNTIYGDLGADLVDGIDGNGEPETPDALYGGFGKDIIAGDNGDLMSGGADQDAFFVVLNAGPIEPAVITDYEPGEGLFVTVPLAFQGQEAVLEQNGAGLDLRLAGQVILRLEGVSDPDAVDLFFSAMDDADQTVTPGALRLGTQEDDSITTGNGDDAVFAGRGDDAITTGAGDDYISLRTAFPFAPEGSLGWGNNTVEAGAGDDRVLGGQGDDRVDAGAGDDLVLGGGGADVVSGGAGNDFIDLFDIDSPAADRGFGGDGADTFRVDNGDVVTGGRGADLFDIVEFERGDDLVTITDFSAGQDRLEVAVNGGDLTVRFEAAGADTRVLIGTRAVALLEGVAPGALSPSAVRVSSWA